MSTQRKLDTEAAIKQQKSFLLAFRHLLQTYDRSRTEILEGIKKLEADLVFLDHAKETAPESIARHTEQLRQLQKRNVAAGALRQRAERDNTPKSVFNRKLRQLEELANDPEVGEVVRRMLAEAKAADKAN